MRDDTMEKAEAYRDKYWAELECAKEDAKLALEKSKLVLAKVNKLIEIEICNYCGEEVLRKLPISFCDFCETAVEGNTTKTYQEKL